MKPRADSALPHSPRVNQEWLKKEVPRFITTTQWPPKSPDLNPLDFYAWSVLEIKILTKKYQSDDHLKKALCQEWGKIPQNYFRAACDDFLGRMNAKIRTKGGQFEQT